MKITLFGLAGTGTSTIAKELSQKYNLKFVSSGDMFRKIAVEKNLTLKQLNEQSINNPQFDLELDEKIKQFGKTNNNFIVDSRLAWKMIPDSFKIKLYCQDEIRFKRIANRDNITFEQAKTDTLYREKTEAQRYLNLYNIQDYSKDDNFDLIIDTSNKSISQICEIIEKKLNLNK